MDFITNISEDLNKETLQNGFWKYIVICKNKY